MGLHASSYAFFGRIVEVVTDRPEILSALDKIYERQRVDAGNAGPEQRVPPAEAAVGDVQAPRVGTSRVVVLARAESVPEEGAGEPATGPVIRAGDRTLRVPDPDELVHYAHLVLINVAATAAPGISVLHAGAAARGGRVALLVGSSGFGKTTLTLELVRRGWRFLSDDFAPVEADGTVQAFPRRVNVTEATLMLLGVAPDPDGLPLVTFGGLPKRMLDPEGIFPASLGRSGRLGWIFLLGPGGGDAGPWTFELDHLPDALVSSVAGISGVTSASIKRSDAAELHVEVAEGARVIPALDRVFAATDVTVLNSRRGGPRPTSFVGPPVAHRVEVEAALPRLLSHDLGLSGRRFLGLADPQAPLRALAHLHGAVLESRCRVFELETGPVHATADLIEDIAAPAH